MPKPISYSQKLQQYVAAKYRQRLNAICPDAQYYQVDAVTNPGQIPAAVDQRAALEYSLTATSFDLYRQIFHECVRRGYTTVYDIGASSGAQANIIELEKLPLQYVAIEPGVTTQLHDYPLINQAYPCPITPAPNAIAVSVLCVGVLHNSDDQDHHVIQQLLTDFDAFILQLDPAVNQRLINSIPNTRLANATADIRFFDAAHTKTLKKLRVKAVAPTHLKEFVLPLNRNCEQGSCHC